LLVIYFDILHFLLVLDITIGISRPNLDPTGDYCRRECTDGWFMNAAQGTTRQGTLFGNGKEYDDEAGDYKQDERVGAVLDLGGGSLRFFRNGVQHSSGCAADSATGPVVAAVQMGYHNESARLWLDRARNRFRFYQPNSRYTGSFCVFGPVLSSPAHGLISLAMA
jgi:hypothetical protein